MSKTTQDLPIVEHPTEEALENWLDEHRGEIDGVWVKVARAGNDTDWIGFDEALHVALCFGLINGVRRQLDRGFYLQKFVARDDDSLWTWTECDRAEWLIEQGRMRPSGMAAIEAAKSDGRWERAYEAQPELKPPTQFLARLASYPEAKAFYESLDRRNRNAILVSMRGTLDPDADRLHIDKVVERLRNHEKPF